MKKPETELAKTDKVMGRLIKKVGPLLLKPTKEHSPYQSLVRAIVYQQLHGKAAATILGRVIDLFPSGKFPRPEDFLKMKDELLRSAGLSRAKAAAIKDLSQKTMDGTVPTHAQILKMNDEEIIERLCEVKGIGRWTAEMLLIFKLGRPDVLPASDYGVRNGFALTYKWRQLPTPKELLIFGEIWRPYRTAAAWYLWRAVDLSKTQENS